MSFTPRSRTPSRTGTPIPGRTPSRLVVPHTLRPTHSLSNLHVHSHGSPSATHAALPAQSNNIAAHTTPPVNQELDSSESSVVNVEGILVQEADADVDTIDDEDGNAVGYITADPGSKQNLRDQLRRTLSKPQSNAGELRLGAIFDEHLESYTK
jgi:vacuolar fusion protein MON1